MIPLSRIRLPAGCLRPALWRRPRTVTTEIRTARVWLSKAGTVRVLCSQIRFGVASSQRGFYAPRWFAERGFQSGAVWVWARLEGSPFRGPRPAFAAAEKAIQAMDHENAKSRRGVR